ncbi:hypothetical protein L1049_026821 [Liquidambar formosana]|uniref:Uncharacterized protein n=1 Tax=Liquidambar formosana TaxID=63359 RepID=A0AAP0R932_LIQFO
MLLLWPYVSPCLCCCTVLLLVALVFLMRGIAKILRFPRPESTANIPPGSRGLPLIGETLQFMAAINCSQGFYDFVRVRHLRYGNCFKTNIFGETHVFVSSTESAKVILNNDLGRFTKRYIRSIADLVGDQSLLCASQQRHKLIRNRLINLFSTASISSFVKQFDELIVKSLADWQNGGTVVVLDEALKITFKAMCKMLMSLESGHELDMLHKDVALVCEAMLAFPLRLPWTRFYKGLQARKRIMSALEKMISERRGLKAHHEDFLQHLLAEDDRANGNEVPSLTDAQIQDNILTMIIAGQDTTASAITWMVKYLDENQQVLDDLGAEQLFLAKKATPKSFLTLEDLNEMAFASKVVKESLRMASVVPWFPRLALQDCEIQGFRIKKGWNVNIDARSIHVDPTVYHDPDKFFPSRFDDELKPYSFLAFGIGGRTCLGMNMAKAMMLVFLHRLITTYNFSVTDRRSSFGGFSRSKLSDWVLWYRFGSSAFFVTVGTVSTAFSETVATVCSCIGGSAFVKHTICLSWCEVSSAGGGSLSAANFMERLTVSDVLVVEIVSCGVVFVRVLAGKLAGLRHQGDDNDVSDDENRGSANEYDGEFTEILSGELDGCRKPRRQPGECDQSDAHLEHEHELLEPSKPSVPAHGVGFLSFDVIKVEGIHFLEKIQETDILIHDGLVFPRERSVNKPALEPIRDRTTTTTRGDCVGRMPAGHFGFFWK